MAIYERLFFLVTITALVLLAELHCQENNSLQRLSNNARTLSFFSSPVIDSLTTRRRCPLCDSSVYSYCSEKLFHDSCCCSNPNNPYEQLPYECHYADCTFLHANTCSEHKLITACCCVNHLY